MMGVRSPQQEVGPVLLLPLLLLLLLVISVVGNTCGCWGTNEVYVHYKPPVSGWFHLSPKGKFLFERVYDVYTAEPQTHCFQLRYSATRGYWLLLEKKAGRWNLLSNSKHTSTKRIIVSCPTGQCSCQVVQVDGSSCLSINGPYNKSSNNTEPLRNSTDIQPTEYKGRRSQCLLAQLAECLDDKKKVSNIEGSCQQYTKPLISNITKSVHKHEHDHYTKLNYTYKLTKADKHDFWLIESKNKVYAVSRNTGPCPDQLTPDSSTWVRTYDSFTENITVTCITWDNPSGD